MYRNHVYSYLGGRRGLINSVEKSRSEELVGLTDSSGYVIMIS